MKNYFTNKKILNELYFVNARKEFPNFFSPLIRLYLFIFGLPLPFKKIRTKQILKLVGKISCKSCLDLGCGVGDIAILISLKFGSNVYGVDIDKPKINIANKISKKYNLRTNFEVVDLEKPFSTKRKYDCLVCSNLAAHLKNDKQLFKEFKGFLKNKGHLVFCEDLETRRIISEKKEKEAGHFRNGYNFYKLVNLLNNEGFEVLEHQFLDTHDICNQYYYRHGKLIQMFIFSFFMIFLKVIEIKKGNRPNMVVLLARRQDFTPKDVIFGEER